MPVHSETRRASDYEQRIDVPVAGDARPALERAAEILCVAGFALTERNGDVLRLDGPGLNSTNQNPVLGASRVRLIAVRGALRVEADLDGARTLQRFVLFFPPLLGLSLGVTLGLAIPDTSVILGLGYGLLPVAPWLVLGPWFSRRLRRRTEQALEAAARNAVELSSLSSSAGSRAATGPGS